MCININKSKFDLILLVIHGTNGLCLYVHYICVFFYLFKRQHYFNIKNHVYYYKDLSDHEYGKGHLSSLVERLCLPQSVFTKGPIGHPKITKEGLSLGRF